MPTHPVGQILLPNLQITITQVGLLTLIYDKEPPIFMIKTLNFLKVGAVSIYFMRTCLEPINGNYIY